MKLLRLSGLLVLAATVLMACGGIASAAAPTSPAGTTYEGKFDAASEGHVVIANSIANIECSSTLEGEVKFPGGNEPISVPLTSLTFTCTNSWAPTVSSPGSLEVHAIPGSQNGTVTWSGTKISFSRFGISCNYKTEATDVGTLTGSKATGATATIDLSGKLIIDSGGSFLCGSNTAAFSGSYKVGAPDYLDIDAEL